MPRQWGTRIDAPIPALTLRHYAGFRVMGAVAGMVVPEAAARFAYRQGLFVLAQSGDSMAIGNDEHFTPGVW